MANEKLPPDEKRCTGTGKDGDRCKAWAMKGAREDLGGERLCAGHGGKGLAASPEAASQAARLSAEGRREQAVVRKMSLRDALAARLEEQADVLVSRLLDI